MEYYALGKNIQAYRANKQLSFPKNDKTLQKNERTKRNDNVYNKHFLKSKKRQGKAKPVVFIHSFIQLTTHSVS